jgi:hypothetical protein
LKAHAPPYGERGFPSRLLDDAAALMVVALAVEPIRLAVEPIPSAARVY